LSNDSEHLKWVTFLKHGLEDWFEDHGEHLLVAELCDWFQDRDDVLIAAGLRWYPVKGRPDLVQAPDVMVVLAHPSGERESYKQWEEDGRPPNVVFEFMGHEKTGSEFLEELQFYSSMGCDELYVFDYRGGRFQAFHRDGNETLIPVNPGPEGSWHSPLLGMDFGLDPQGHLWIRRPDGKLMETHKEVAERAKRYAAKLRELGIDPDQI